MSNEKKYEIIKDDYIVIQQGNIQYKLYRIRALINIPSAGVNAGDLGGRIAGEYNLSQNGNCWVGQFCKVYDNATVMGNAFINGHDTIYGCATIKDDAYIHANCRIFGSATICGNSKIMDCNVSVYGNAFIGGHAFIGTDGNIYDKAIIKDHAKVMYHSDVCGNANIGGMSIIDRHSTILEDAKINGQSYVFNSVVGGSVDIVDLKVPSRRKVYDTNEEILQEIEEEAN